MAISKVIYISSDEATPEVWMDVTQKTVTSGTMLNGTTALKNDGTDITGNISNMTLPTSAAASATSGYTSKATVSRSTSDQYINIPPGYNSTGGYYKVNAVANGSVTAPSTISGSSATVSTGTNTLTLSKTVSVTPNVTTAGYISSGTAGNASVSLTASVSTRSSSSLSTSGATVTAPAGYYASDASKSVSSMTLPTSTSTSATSGYTSKTTVSRSTSDQYINIPTGYNSSGAYYKINAVANGSAATPSTSITANPSISVGSDGLITASVSASQSVTPTVSAGYISSGTAGTVSVSGSNTSQLTTQAAQTIYPSTSDQTISSGKYLTGAQTVKGVLVSDTLTAANIANGVTVKIGDSADDDRIMSVTGTLESGTHTATITQRDANVYGGVKVNNTGTSYEAVGTTFTFKYGDTLSVNAKRSSGSGEVYVNGVLKGRGSSSVKVRLPNGDIEIAFTNPSELSVSQTLITSNATFDPDVTKGFFERTEYYPILPPDATKIGNGMFYSYSSSLTTLTLPSGLTRIGSYAFYNCAYLALTSLPNGIVYIDPYAFSGCTRLALTSLPSSLTDIGQYAFQRCSNLALTSLPSGLTYIGADAFYNCSQLAITSIPSTVSSIGSYAFYGCTSLDLTSFSPSSSYTSISSYTFYGCTSLALISLPSTITSIEGSAFNGCTSLALTSLPSGVTSIGDSSFNGCTAITISSLPSSVTTIGASAFNGCTGLTSISCSGTITSLGTYAFANDSSLKTVSFPNMALTSNIGTVFGNSTAASACQELETVDLGATTGIAANAFINCYKLSTLVLRKTSVATLGGTSAFTNTPMSGYNSLTGTVYVPSALISSYQTATNWKTLYNNGTVTFSAIEGSAYEL